MCCSLLLGQQPYHVRLRSRPFTLWRHSPLNFRMAVGFHVARSSVPDASSARELNPRSIRVSGVAGCRNTCDRSIRRHRAGDGLHAASMPFQLDASGPHSASGPASCDRACGIPIVSRGDRSSRIATAFARRSTRPASSTRRQWHCKAPPKLLAIRPSRRHVQRIPERSLSIALPVSAERYARRSPRSNVGTLWSEVCVTASVSITRRQICPLAGTSANRMPALIRKPLGVVSLRHTSARSFV